MSILFITVISNSDIEQVAKIRWHGCKEHLKVSKMAKFMGNGNSV